MNALGRIAGRPFDKAGTPPVLVKGWWRRILRQDPCSYCGTTTPEPGLWARSLDHIHPRAAGGTRDRNLTAACQACNTRKDRTSLLHFLLERRGS